jgi:hypothetical protein
MYVKYPPEENTQNLTELLFVSFSASFLCHFVAQKPGNPKIVNLLREKDILPVQCQHTTITRFVL